MQSLFRGRHFIDVEDFSKEEVDTMLEVSFDFKKNFAMGVPTPTLQYKTMFLMFFEQSTRTRNSMEAGIAQLGGHANYLDTSSMQIAHGESPKDTAIILSRFGHAIACRYCNWGIGNKYLNEMAKWSAVPVMNLQCDLYHPFQVLADLMTMKEKKGKLQGLNFVFIGDGDDNLTHSYLLGCSLVGMNVTVISPKKHWPKEQYVLKAREISAQKNHTVTVTDDINAVTQADVVATDTWVSFWYENERAQRLTHLKNYTITQDVMRKAKPDAIFMHCMPIYYGEEVTKEVAHGPQSVIIDEAENRMWVQMALLTTLLR